MLRSSTLVVPFLAMLIGTANAAELTPPPVEPEWEFTVVPYVWAAGLDGTVGEFGLPPVDVDLSFSDILDHFDIGLMGAAEARYDRFSVATDLLWIKLSAEKGTP